MDIPQHTRQFYPDELRLLKTLKSRSEKEKVHKIKLYHFLIAAFLVAGGTYLSLIIKTGFFVFIFGILAVFAFGFIIFTPFEIYKQKKKQSVFLKEISHFLEKGTVNITPVNARRIALAPEYEDEGDLFIIEYDIDKVLYFWDHDNALRKKFPCLQFEIYEDQFAKLIGRLVYPLSERIAPVLIDKKAKWKYMGKVGGPGHLQTQMISLDKVVEEYNSYA
jgi:hypothetical protein